MKNKKLRKASGGLTFNNDFKAKGNLYAEDNSNVSYMNNKKVKTTEKHSDTSIGIQVAIPG